LEEYARKHKFFNYEFFVDDGFSGVRFSRPDFEKMMDKVEANEIDTIIVKDLSRIGRNYLLVGNLIENILPKHNVRFIAINDNVDTETSENEFMPFKNLFNEWHARDTSRKIKAVKKAKTQRGERLSGTYPYGYMISPNDRNKLIPNPDTAPIIKKIFEMYSKGKRIADIHRWLEENKVLTPYAYLYSVTGNSGYGKVNDNPYTWVPSTIFSILDRVEYIGHLATNKGYNISYKNQRRVLNDKKDWLIFEDAHEPLIDLMTWDVVRKRRETISRPRRTGTIDELSGLLFCADCGRKMYFKQNVKSKYKYEYYVCSGYNNKKECTTHSIKKSLVKAVILNDLQRITSITQQFEDCYLMDIMLKDIEKELEDNDNNHDRLNEVNKRVDEIDVIIKRLYEDNVIGKITDERFMQLNSDYETEQSKLKEELSELENQVNKNRYIVREKKDFLKLVRKYTDIKELEYDVVRELIEKVTIHDQPQKGEPRQIDIYYRFAGKVNYHYMLDEEEVDAV